MKMLEALKKGLVNLERHIENIKKFGLPVAVAVNHFIADTENEVNELINSCNKLGVKATLCTALGKWWRRNKRFSFTCC